MNAELRVLTGRHAGTRVPLLPGSYQLGRDEDADLQLTDWSRPPLILEIDANANVRYASTDPADAAQPLQRFVPVCFDAIVLCVGTEGHAWPQELQLLRAALQPQPARGTAAASAARSTPRKRHLVWIALVSAFALTLTAWGYDAPDTHAGRVAPARIAQTRQAFARLGQTELRLRDAGDHVEIDGMVRSEADAQRVEHWLQGHPGPWRMHFGVAETLIESMSESLHEPNLQIRYRGNGVYDVVGASEHRDAVARRLEQLRRDMGSQVVRIDARLRSLDPHDALPDTYDTALSVDALHYVETPDGSKHFSSFSQ